MGRVAEAYAEQQALADQPYRGRLDPAVVRQQIENLKIVCPEAWDSEDEQLLTDMLAGSTDLMEYLTIIGEQRQEATAMAAGIASRIAELGIRQERYERREKARRELAFKLMTAAELPKAELAIATLSIRRVPPKVVITNEDDLPDVACKFIRKPDMAKIKELLTDKTGVCAGAEMSNGGETISIRTK